jgi:pimeloyl-ACP methyl ester carboxylesterase
VITPVVDFLRARPDVDRRRISLVGASFGGFLTARAAAHEHRLAALVTDTGVTDPFAMAKRSEIYGNGGGFERMIDARRFVLRRAEARSRSWKRASPASSRSSTA